MRLHNMTDKAVTSNAFSQYDRQSSHVECIFTIWQTKQSRRMRIHNLADKVVTSNAPSQYGRQSSHIECIFTIWQTKQSHRMRIHNLADKVVTSNAPCCDLRIWYFPYMLYNKANILHIKAIFKGNTVTVRFHFRWQMNKTKHKEHDTPHINCLLFIRNVDISYVSNIELRGGSLTSRVHFLANLLNCFLISFDNVYIS